MTQHRQFSLTAAKRKTIYKEFSCERSEFSHFVQGKAMPEMKLTDLRVMFEIVKVCFEITEPSFTISGDCSTKRCR